MTSAGPWFSLDWLYRKEGARSIERFSFLLSFYAAWNGATINSLAPVPFEYYVVRGFFFLFSFLFNLFFVFFSLSLYCVCVSILLLCSTTSQQNGFQSWLLGCTRGNKSWHVSRSMPIHATKVHYLNLVRPFSLSLLFPYSLCMASFIFYLYSPILQTTFLCFLHQSSFLFHEFFFLSKLDHATVSRALLICHLI